MLLLLYPLWSETVPSSCCVHHTQLTYATRHSFVVAGNSSVSASPVCKGQEMSDMYHVSVVILETVPSSCCVHHTQLTYATRHSVVVAGSSSMSASPVCRGQEMSDMYHVSLALILALPLATSPSPTPSH